jgi:hypothetical protein
MNDEYISGDSGFNANADNSVSTAIDKPIDEYCLHDEPFDTNLNLKMIIFVFFAILIVFGLAVLIVFMTRIGLEPTGSPNSGFGRLPNVSSPYNSLDNTQNLPIQDSSFARPDFLSTIPSSSLELAPIDLVPTSHWAISNDVFTVPYYISLRNGGLSISPVSSSTISGKISTTNVPTTRLTISFIVSSDMDIPLNYKPKLVQISPLTATYSLGGNASSRILIYLCRGCPFITFEIVNAGLSFIGVKSLSINDNDNYMLFSQNGFNYMLTGAYNQDLNADSLTFQNMTGVVRLAYIPSNADSDFAHNLYLYSESYPVFSTVTYQNSSDDVSYHVKFDTRSSSSELNDIVMLKPPQVTDIDGVMNLNDIKYDTVVRGQNVTLDAIVGDTWEISLDNIPITVATSLPPDQKALILEQWTIEINNYMNNNTLNNSAFISGMSSIAMWARYCLGCGQLLNIPFLLKVSNQPDISEGITNFANYVESVLNHVLSLFRYDTVWGGLNSSIPSTGNASYAAYYNHLYVVGGIAYALYAYLNATGDSTVIVRFQSSILTMYRDVLNPSSDDNYYPTFRNMDWYFGQTYNTGIDAIADSGTSNPGYKSESEISVAMTSIYSLYLLSRKLTALNASVANNLVNLTKIALYTVYNSYKSYYGTVITIPSELLPVSFVSEVGYGFGAADDFSFSPLSNNQALASAFYYASLAAPFTDFSNNDHAKETLAGYFDELSALSAIARTDQSYSILAYIYSMMAYDATNECLFKDTYAELNGKESLMAFGVTISGTLLWIANRIQININDI